MHEDALVQCGHVPSPNQWRLFCRDFATLTAMFSTAAVLKGSLPSVMLQSLTSIRPVKSSPKVDLHS